jgi:sugar phosphate isomerase/epimerase
VRHAAIGTALTAAVSVRELGGSILVVHVTDVARAAGEVEGRLARAVDSLSVVARACHQMHVTLAVESPLPNLVGGSVDEFEWVLDRLPPSVGVCLDISHATLGRHWDEMLALAGHRLVHVHASDHRGQTDDHLAPGDGVIDWRTIGGDLTAAGYRGWIILELAMPQGSLRAYLRRARSRLEQLLET